MSGPTVVKLKITSADNKVTVQATPPVVNKVVVHTTQNVLKAGVSVSGPRGPQGMPGSGGDLNFKQDFLTSSSITVNHNLGKFPSVTVIDSADDEVFGDTQYVDLNTLIVRFSAAFSGSIVCN